MKMLTPGEEAAMLQGLVNETAFYITIDHTAVGMPTAEIYNEVE